MARHNLTANTITPTGAPIGVPIDTLVVALMLALPWLGGCRPANPQADRAPSVRPTEPESTSQDADNEVSRKGEPTGADGDNNSNADNMGTLVPSTEVAPSMKRPTGDEPQGTETATMGTGAAAMEPTNFARVVLLAQDGPLVFDFLFEVPDAVVEVASETQRDGGLESVPSDDANRADGVEENRMARLPAGDARAVGPFRLRVANYYEEIQRRQSPIGSALDLNGDGLLDAAEIRMAPNSLAHFDSNAREVLLPMDFQPATPDTPAPLTRRRPHLPDRVIALRQLRDPGQLLHELEDVYALGQTITSKSFAAPPDRFQQLDANGDGVWQPEEMSRWSELPADLIVRLRFREFQAHPTAVLESAPAVEVVSTSADLKSRHRELAVLADRLILSLPDVKFTVIQRDGVSYPRSESSSMTNPTIRARAGHEPDALFALLDQDHDGRLTTREIIQASDRLQAWIPRGERELDLARIPEAFVMVVVRGMPEDDAMVFPTDYSLRPKPANAPPWFLAMDRNRDGELSRSEFLGTDQQFQQLDRNGDGLLDIQEVGQHGGGF